MLRRLVLTLSLVLTTTLVPPGRCAEDQFFDSAGVKIRYVVEGRGEPVLFIHGYTIGLDMNWKVPGILESLAREYQVIALDNRGHGKSDKPHDPKRYGEEMAEDAVRLLDHLKIQKAHIVGYSMGGVITAKLLATHPERLRTATLGGHGGLKAGTDLSFYERLAESIDAGEGLTPLIVRLTPPGQPAPSEAEIKATNAFILANNDPKALAAVARGFKGLTVPWDKLEANQVPTLALVGERDPLKKGVDELAGRMANLKVVVIKDADHRSAFGKPEFLKALQAFLAEHRTR